MKLSFLLTTILTFVTCGISQRPHIYNYNYNYNFRQPSRRPISSFQQQRPRPHQPISSPASQSCIYNGQFLPNSKDSRQYSVCMRAQNTNVWFKYSYKCPPFTGYDALRSQCIQGLPETTTTTTEASASVLNIAQPPISSTAEDSKKPESSTSSTQTEVVTEQETSTLQIPTTIVPELSSSSEEIFMTHPPHFTRPGASSISQVSPPVHVAWNPTLPSARPRPTAQKPMTIVYNPNSEHFKTSTRTPPISSADYERLTFLNALQQNKLTNGLPHLSAAQKIPSDSNMVSATSSNSPVTDSWSYGDKETEASTRFPARWRPKSPLNKSSSFES